MLEIPEEELQLKTSSLDPTQLSKRDLMTIAEIALDKYLELKEDNSALPLIQSYRSDLIHDLEVIEKCITKINEENE